MASYIALFMAVVPCCPFVSLAGGFLGMVVLSRMQKAGAGPNAPGRKVAIVAAVTGLLMSIATTGLYTWWQHRMETAFRQEAITELEQVIRSSMAGDAATARSLWHPSSDAPSSVEFETFGNTLQHRYGRLQRFAIDSFVIDGTPRSPTIDMSGLFTFETRELAGSAKLYLRQPTGPFSVDLGLAKILIEDRTDGNVVLSD